MNLYFYIDTQNMASCVGDAITEEILATGAGTVVGGIIGSLIAPGLGTVIGAGLGTWVGNLFGSSLETVKQNSYQSLCRKLDENFPNIENDAKQQMNNYFNQSGQSLEVLITHYVEVYNRTVENMIQSLQQEKQDILNKKRQTEDDIRQIEAQRKELERIRQYLSMHKK